MRLYYEPLVPWLWVGSLVMMIGGVVSLSDRRLRVGAPQPKPAKAPSGQAVPAE